MGRDIRAIVHLKKSGELFNLIIIAFAIAVGLITSYFSGVFDEGPKEVAEIVAILVATSFAAVGCFFKIFLMVDEIPKGLIFGMTRRKEFIYSRIIDLLEILVVAIILIPLSGLNPITIFKCAFLWYGIINIVEGLVGNYVVRYGKAVFITYYVVLMVLCIGLPRFISMLPGGFNLFAVVIDHLVNPFYNQASVWVPIVGVIAVGIIINWITFRKIPVNTNI